MIKFFKTNKEKNGILHPDPRTILILIFLGNIAVFSIPSFEGEILLVCMTLVFAFLCGTYRTPLKIAIIYFLFITIDYICMNMLNWGFANNIALGVRFLRKILPCGLLGSILVSTTRVNEFMIALSKIGLPKSILIPMTVMLRYFPTISEDRRKIKKGVKMRGITPGFVGILRNPMETIEYIYVPLMMSASRRADELSAAAISRGIENPRPRTSVQKIKFSFGDYITIVAGVCYLMFIWRVFV